MEDRPLERSTRPGERNASSSDVVAVDLGGRLELGRNSVSFIDGAVYLMQQRIDAGGRDAELLQQMIPQVRSGNLTLPILPEAAVRAMELMETPEAEIGELAALVESDPALATKVVGVANSAYFRGIDPAGSVQQALMRIGLREASHVVLAVAMRSTLFRISGFETEVASVWRHSVLSAELCRLVLDVAKQSDTSGYLLGLVHDIGRVVVFSFAAHAQRPSHGARRFAADQVELAADALHGALGALVLDSWQFDSEFVYASGHHHDPRGSLPADEPGHLLRALRLADQLAHQIENGRESASPGQSSIAEQAIEHWGEWGQSEGALLEAKLLLAQDRFRSIMALA